MACIVYDAAAVTAVGVPEISPVFVSKVRPAGRAGETDHETTAPPLSVGTIVVIPESLVNV